MSSEIPMRERFSPLTPRSGEYYLRETGLKPRDLRGKFILNAGSGETDLESYLREEGIKCTVVNLDLAYGSRIKPNFPPFKPWSGYTPPNAVGGDLTRIPFFNNFFDVTFVSNTMGIWLNAAERQETAIGELLRVTRGRVYIFPALKGLVAFSRKNTSHIRDAGNSLVLSK